MLYHPTFPFLEYVQGLLLIEHGVLGIKSRGHMQAYTVSMLPIYKFYYLLIKVLLQYNILYFSDTESKNLYIYVKFTIKSKCIYDIIKTIPVRSLKGRVI